MYISELQLATLKLRNPELSITYSQILSALVLVYVLLTVTKDIAPCPKIAFCFRNVWPGGSIGAAKTRGEK